MQCRLINPAKTNIGKISKQIISKHLIKIREYTGSNQWTNTDGVLKWFSALKNKRDLTFLKFDILSFYPSISEKLFDETVNWTNRISALTTEELAIVKHSRKSFLFSKGEPWLKKTSKNFDVTMGAYDGAEVCELVGLYILNKLESLINQEYVGLYRDDGLAVLDLPGPQIEQLRKNMFKLFKSFGLSITISANIKSTEFLDTWMDLSTGEYRPFLKANSTPIYIHADSNHPTSVRRQIPNMISQRVSHLSSSETVFNSSKKVYEDALKNSGYKESISYIEKDSKRKHKRCRQIIWFNPPFSQSVKTNIGAKFLKLVEKHFKNTELHRHFNRKTIKVSYSCMSNIETIISGHNKKLLNANAISKSPRKCNCRGGITNCPVEGNCLTSSVIYKAEISEDKSSTSCSYIGLAATSFKERYNNHISSFKNYSQKEKTTLSKHVWELKERGANFSIKWFIIKRCNSYHPNIRQCNLCLMEKTLILTAENLNLLNARSEIMSKCRHRRKYLLSNLIT